MKFKNNIEIKNRKARFEFEILDKYMAGIVLGGEQKLKRYV
ncbi:tmRNA-binding protein SmpB [Nonlabens ulvanivorans]|uniref:TmRNA-binding protein SmpB n=1 Tax=Nonlabens ulvanivorans TaxID=906888 RepID=A0A081DBE6_NONUL|nr:tmRNA-binding protein SmpB [Nonlabens ulvanivorans]GAL01221.1 tmRNA-binding protein SmpB [Nonlabens ulvanivorans]GAL76507.1 tmRNA-binding protein SmpB [Nonlabens ulvanivorans]